MMERLPEFKNAKEEADFWETHSPLDFPDEFEEVTEPIVDRRTRKGVPATQREEMPLSLTDLSPLLPLLHEAPFGLVTDLDGTISPMFRTPAEAKVSPACRRYLGAIARKVALVAVVSGRATEDVRRIVGLEGIVYVGLHGFSLAMPPVWGEEEAATYNVLTRSLLDDLRRTVTSPGIAIEDKGPLIAIHYRQAPDPPAARRAILDAVGAVPAARRFALHEGKMFVELRPPVPSMNKGAAVRHLATERGLRSVIYLGDDVTDIDAFRALHEPGAFRGASVVVAGEETPPEVVAAADYRLEGVAGTEWLLGELAVALGAQPTQA
jgi:trehalose 6-phosphate phosphatase